MATLDRLVPPVTAGAPVGAWTPRRAIVVAVSLVAIIALLQVLQSSSAAHTGQTLQKLEAEKAQRNAEIHQLEAEIGALSSLDRIQQTATTKLGMIPAHSVQYLSVNVPGPTGPLLPQPIAAPAAGSSPAPDPAPPWWQSLFKSLPLH